MTEENVSGGKLLPPLMLTADSLSATYLANFINMSQGIEKSLEQLLIEHLIDTDRLRDDPSYRLPLYKVFNLLGAFSETLRSLEAVSALRIKSFASLGYAAMSSQHLREAIERLSRFESLVWTVGDVSLQNIPLVKELSSLPDSVSEQDCCQLIWQGKSFVPARAVEIAVVGWLNIGSQIGGWDISQVSLSFKHSSLNPVSEYEKILGCKVSFEEQQHSIIFPRVWLDQALADFDPELSRVMDEQSEYFLKNFPLHANFENEIRRIIVNALPDGKYALEDIALEFSITVRRLRQIMTEQGLNYRDILSDTCRDLADYYLKNTSLPISEVSILCGFSEQSGFTRAVKRWFDKTPKELRD